VAAAREANLALDEANPRPARDRRCKGISGPAKGILGDAWHPFPTSTQLLVAYVHIRIAYLYVQ